MDIPALSVAMNQANLAQNVDIALTKKMLDTAQQNADQTLKLIQHPTLGQKIDLKA
ncbi:YjfB family protein [Bacillus halotolerans]|uniref:YjfB family protein n=1 Tax=Bacillus halotolerans TaxID=260554 RepID=UPI002DBC077E|nr:YjfB family protein [Bacillus halotolerans]MEC1406095.1 YjfB family protein [Bacillus halotolerans]